MPKLLKDKRIFIWGWDYEVDEYEPTKPLGEVWAHFRSMSVRETFNAGADHAWNNVYFTFTKPSFELNTYAEIEYPVGSGKRYIIEGIDLYEDRDGANIRVQARTQYA